jgi:hypothetical protein
VREGECTQGANLVLTFEGASPDISIEGIDQLPGRYNYFLGSDPSKWRTEVPSYTSIRYRGLYPGVDMVVRDQDGRLEYDLILDAGADLAPIVVHCEGADSMEVDEEGSLVLHTAAGDVTQRRPDTHEIGPGGTGEPIACSYRLLAQNCFGFDVPSRQGDLALVIDPGLIYGTFLGGSHDDQTTGIAVDALGSVLATGYTSSSDFPTTPGAYDTSFNAGNVDAFVAKLDASGTTLLYGTFLGGSGSDFANAVAVDASGAALITGSTYSSDFPTTAGAYDTSFNGGGVNPTDAFVVKLDPTGSSLLYGTFLGGSDADVANGIAVDASGAVLVTGLTVSSDFPTTPGAFDTSFNSTGYCDAFVAKLSASGTTLLYGTYLGGSGCDDAFGIAIDASGAALVTGETTSSDFPTTPGSYDTSFDYSGNYRAFVTKLSESGTTLLYGTYLGKVSEAHGIAVDASGAALVTGTVSSNFPTTPGAYDTSFNGGDNDAFVAKLSANGTSLLYGTYLGGSDSDVANGIALDASGAALVTGYTFSSDFPTTPGAFGTSFNGNIDAFVTKLNASGSALVYSTLLGGTDYDLAYATAVDSAGAALVTGYTASLDFPTTPGAYDTTYNALNDAFVAKLDLCVAFARNYGSGWPGTLGVPSLMASGPPVLCTPITIAIGNSSGATTAAVLLVGFQPASIPTAFSGTLLVLPTFVLPFTLPASGASVPYSVLCGDEFCGLALFLQVLEVDPGASGGVSFTQGLELIHGQ